MTLTEFLLARIADLEATTKADKWDQWHAPGCGMYADSPWQECDCDATARVLAECEAKRRIVELHTPILHTEWPVWFCPTCAHPEKPAVEWGTAVWMSGFVNEQGDPAVERLSTSVLHPGADAPCQTLRALALPYADHPDFREEWRP